MLFRGVIVVFAYKETKKRKKRKSKKENASFPKSPHHT